MRLRSKILLGLIALAAVGMLLFLSARNPAERELRETRRALRRQGFTTELREFDHSLPPDVARRASLLGAMSWAEFTNHPNPSPIMREIPNLLMLEGSNSALVIWKIPRLREYQDYYGRGRDLWPEISEILRTNRLRLDAARQAAVSGPIRFEPLQSQRPNPLVPYLAELKGLTTSFGAQTILALHDGDLEAAWANLLACSCLVIAYEPEPVEISHLVRFACASIAYSTTWNALQAHDWTDTRLAELQGRWEKADFWSGLPETVARWRAATTAMCQLERKEPVRFGLTFDQMLQHPPSAWLALKYYWHQISYPQRGSYQQERALLLYYRDRELELRQAVHAGTWSQMRHLAAITNVVRFQSRYASRVGVDLNSRNLSLALAAEGQSLLARAAEAEAQRRLMVTALALERFRKRRGCYPKTLEQLVPELLPSPPTDFMDGQPLRYQLSDDGHFVLYSVGLDCADNGGTMSEPTAAWSYGVGSAFQWGPDLVWPRPVFDSEEELPREQGERAVQPK